MKKDIARVFGSNLIKMLVTLITAFVIPMVLSIENYGYYKLFIFYSSYVGIAHFGFCDGIYLQYGGVGIDKINKKQVRNEWSTLLIHEAMIGLAIVVFGVIKCNLIIICLGLTVVPTILFTFYTYVYQATGEFVRYTRIMNISTAVNLFVNLCLVVLQVDNYKIYVICHVGICILSFIIGTISFNGNNWIGFTGFSYTILFKFIKSGFLLMAGNFAYTLFIGIDKWFIKFTMEITDFSMYSFASQILTVVNMFITPISMTLYSNISKKKNHEFEVRIKKIMISFLMVFPTIIYALSFVIRHYVIKYIPAIDVVSILLITQIFLSLNLSIYINMYKAYKKQKEYFIQLVMALIVAIFLDIIVYLIGSNIIGYAFVTLISCLIWLTLNMKSFPHLVPGVKELFYVAIMMGTYLITLLIENEVICFAIYFPLYLIFTKLLMNNEWMYVVRQLTSGYRKINEYLGR